MIDPAEKYRTNVSPEHRVSMEAIGFARLLLAQHRAGYDAFIKAEQDMHSFGGMFDPTLYRDMLYSQSFKQQVRLVKAAVAFLNEVDAIAQAIGEPTQ